MTVVNTRTFGFTQVSESRLQHILDMCGTNSAGEAVDKALALLEWALEHAESGKIICALDADTGVAYTKYFRLYDIIGLFGLYEMGDPSHVLKRGAGLPAVLRVAAPPTLR
jgi:hypothetical protein